MAKRTGADKEGESSPKIVIGSNSAPETFLEAVRDFIAADKVLKAANDARKDIRKAWKTRGIELKIADKMVSMAEWTRAEIRAYFETEKAYAEYLGLPTGADVTFFTKTPEGEIERIEWEARGKTAARLGKAGHPPEGASGDQIAHFMRGFADEDEQQWEEAEPNSATVKAPAPVVGNPASDTSTGDDEQFAKDSPESDPDGDDAEGDLDGPIEEGVTNDAPVELAEADVVSITRGKKPAKPKEAVH